MIPINSCSLVLYTECTMYREESIYNETEVVPDATYVPWECYNETITVTHDKQVSSVTKKKPATFCVRTFCCTYTRTDRVGTNT